jgi:hypothetical protein
MSQDELNTLLAGTDFEIGFEYVYVIKTCVYTAFFVSLQPVISILAIIGLFLMYWAEKYVLFNRSKRPPPGSDIINQAMSQIIYLCPLVYALGSLTWPVFIPDGTPRESMIPNLIAIGISIVMFIIPLEAICNCCINEDERANAELIYEKERIFFTTEYDRRNPATLKAGYEDYVKYLQDIKNKIDSKSTDASTTVSDDVKNQFNDIFMKQALQTQTPGFSGGNLFFAEGGFGGGGNRQQSAVNPFALMQLATAQPQMQQMPPPMFNPAAMMFNQQPRQMHPSQNQVYPQPPPTTIPHNAPMMPPQPVFTPSNLMGPQQGFNNPGFAQPQQQQQFGFAPPPQQFGFAPPPQQAFGFAPPGNQFGFAPPRQFGFGPTMGSYGGFGFNM